ncbi:penicillin amidase [Pseudomonas versuta]|nr:penicillin amidase [Pseudomonas versuta]
MYSFKPHRLAQPRVFGRTMRLALLGLGLGSVAQQGLAAQVTIKRDHYGVPHIYAQDLGGLYFGYGYAVAQDRLYQMEMARRSSNGTVAQVLGKDYLEIDKATRSNFDPASIRAQLQALPVDDRQIFEGYAAGFNARIREVLADKPNLLAIEFVEEGFEPAPWSPEDVANIWVGLILNRFFAGTQEVANLQLLERLQASRGTLIGQQLYDQLRWLEDPQAPSTSAKAAGPLRNYNSAQGLQPLSVAAAHTWRSQQIARLGQAAADAMPTASNAWVVSPAKSQDGRAVLFNGPQQGWFNPSITYSVGLHGAGYDFTGSTPVALPAILFGSNGHIAWGSTVGALDTNDVYQEQLNPQNRFEYRYDGHYQPMHKRTETIEVKGEAPYTLEVYSTVHGFVSTWDVANQTAYSQKRSWEGREIESLMGWAGLAKAHNWDEFLLQAERVSVSINWFYADTLGNIGHVAVGKQPQRPGHQPVQFPALGDGSMEWQGFLPFAGNPRSYNPDQGYLVSWNNQPAPGLRADGANYSRVDRVNELIAPLQAKARLSLDDIWDVDRRGAFADLNARYFVPSIVAATRNLPVADPARQAADILQQWNLQNRDDQGKGVYDSPAVPIMRGWLAAMYSRVLQDDLPAEVFKVYAGAGYPTQYSPVSPQPGNASKLLWNALQGKHASVPQGYDFFNGEAPEAVVLEVLRSTLKALLATQGADLQAWRTPVASMRFAALNAIGVPWASKDRQPALAPFMNRGSETFRVSLGSDGVSMCSVVPPGQSGFVAANGEASKHVADQLTLYRDHGCKQDWLSESQVQANLESSLTLEY